MQWRESATGYFRADRGAWTLGGDRMRNRNFGAATIIVGLAFAGVPPFATCASGSGDAPASSHVANVARGKPVKADSIYNATYLPEYAVDGDRENVSSRWLSARTNNLDWSKSPHWIEIDLLGTYSISEVRFWSGAQNEYKWPPADFAFQRWHEGAWVDVFNETGNDKPVYSRRFPPVPAQRVRLFATRGTDPGALRLYEIEVFGY